MMILILLVEVLLMYCFLSLYLVIYISCLCFALVIFAIRKYF